MLAFAKELEGLELEDTDAIASAAACDDLFGVKSLAALKKLERSDAEAVAVAATLKKVPAKDFIALWGKLVSEEEEDEKEEDKEQVRACPLLGLLKMRIQNYISALGPFMHSRRLRIKWRVY